MADAYSTVTGIASRFWGSPVLQNSDGTLYCPGFTGDTYGKRPWQSVVIAVPYSSPSLPQTPGVCEVTAVRERDVDKKKKKGSDGARITLAGLEPAMVEIRIKIWTPQQLLELEKLRTIIFPPRQKQTTTKVSKALSYPTGYGAAAFFAVAGGGITTIPAAGPITTTTTTKTQTKSVTVSQPFDVSHPDLDAKHIRALIFVKETGPDNGPEPGTKIFTLHAVEFMPPNNGVNATNTPTSSKGAAPLPSTLDDGAGLPPGSNHVNTDP